MDNIRVNIPGAVRERMKSLVLASLNSNPLAVERAITVLYSRQTAVEKQTETTREDNRLGVRHNHARKIAYYGRWLASGRHLTGHHLEQARQIARTYAGSQLAELAAVKAGLVKG